MSPNALYHGNDEITSGVKELSSVRAQEDVISLDVFLLYFMSKWSRNEAATTFNS